MNAPRTLIALLGGAAGLSLAGAAFAQDVAPANEADIEGPQAAIVEEAEPAAPASAQTPDADAAEPADVEGPQAAIVEEELENGAAATIDAAGIGDDAREALNAGDGEAPGPGHTNADRFNDDELAGVSVGEGSPEALAAEAAATGQPTQEAVDRVLTDAQPEAKQNEVQVIPTETDETEIVLDAHPAAEDAAATPAAASAPEVDDAQLLEAFMDMDTDGDLLLTQAEFGAWGGWAPGRAPSFGDLDVNGTGVVGFGEYRVWSAIQAGTGGPAS